MDFMHEFGNFSFIFVVNRPCLLCCAFQSLPSTSKMNPEAHVKRMGEIKAKIDNHKAEVEKERGFSSAHTMSRHAMQLEMVLNQGIIILFLRAAVSLALVSVVGSFTYIVYF